PATVAPAPSVPTRDRLTNVASAVGLDFRQGSFHFGMSNDYKAMMGGGVCWLDYNDDGWLDLFAVNSYASADTSRWEARGGLPRTALYENLHGRFRDVSPQSHADLPVQGDGCVAGGACLEAAAPRLGVGAVFLDYDDDRRPDLYGANDEDPNQLYENVAWPGGAKADPAGLGFRFEERAAAEGVDDRFAGMGVAVK